MAEYQPGTCNINQEGVDYRRNVSYGAITFALFAYVAFVFATGVAAAVAGFAAGVVMFVGVLNYLQAKNSFCASHGMAGTQQAADGATEAKTVEDESAVEKDKARSRSMIVQAIAISVGVTVVFVVAALIVQ